MKHPHVVSLEMESPPEVVTYGCHRHGERVRESVFQLRQLWSLQMYKDPVTLEMNGERYAIARGMISLIPPDREYRFLFKKSCEQLYVHFRAGLPRGMEMRFKTVHATGRSRAYFQTLFQRSILWNGLVPQRRQAGLWEFLWRLWEHGRDEAEGAGGGRSVVQNALLIIRASRQSPPSVAALAQTVGCSHTHLVRLFRREFGTTVEGFIRRFRIQSILPELAYGRTPIKNMALETGYWDLQHFNKAFRKEVGCSPRAFRDRYVLDKGP